MWFIIDSEGQNLPYYFIKSETYLSKLHRRRIKKCMYTAHTIDGG